MSFNIFLSPEGRLKDLEYAQEAANLGSTSCGIKTKDFIFILSERKKKKSLDYLNDQKIYVLDKNKGCCVSGLISDSRKIIDNVRIYCENKYFLINSYPSIEECSNLINNLITSYNTNNDVNKISPRPLGTSFLLFGKSNKKLELIKVDPSGRYIKDKILAIGEGSKDVLIILQEGYRSNMKKIEAKTLAFKTLRAISESILNEKNVEAAQISESNTLRILFKEEINQILKLI
ncbi:26S proteasome SU A5 (nucleomorph) [Guillardia theta]|uniref:26S proteasome SU A5 n=1 Tax=Guillardia theta TaxID=55529 RepID=Q98RV9_GUITH|nr:26S proteasome SU A5 [Guillardia theta]AAK39841.1 26S proteasome SU A5 [Guillardia theta]|mmetsp:Transcript_37596/g.118696  ORF Transcript_37596/g.118696 Transcript_37596/m.118696 type:complete len:233 (-) Transcript_37596:1427-2125(-)